MGGALQRGPGGPWPTQNFGWVGRSAFGPANNWPVFSLFLAVKLDKKRIFVAIKASCGFCDMFEFLPASLSHNH